MELHENPYEPRESLGLWIEWEQDKGSAEADPYSYAIVIIRTALEFALDDGINGAMNETEFSILEDIGKLIADRDPASQPHPRPA